MGTLESNGERFSHATCCAYARGLLLGAGVLGVWACFGREAKGTPAPAVTVENGLLSQLVSASGSTSEALPPGPERCFPAGLSVPAPE
jgi:hypothetical protein